MDHHRISQLEKDKIPRELLDLGTHIAALLESLQGDLEESYARVLESVKRRKRILSLVQEALSQLRLDVKYLMFDLEVTRQERDELRQQLGELE